MSSRERFNQEALWRKAELFLATALKDIKKGLSQPQYPKWLKSQIGDFENVFQLVGNETFKEKLRTVNIEKSHPAIVASKRFELDLDFYVQVHHAIYLESEDLISVEASYASSFCDSWPLQYLAGEMIGSRCTTCKDIVGLKEAHRLPQSTHGCHEAFEFVNQALNLGLQEENVQILIDGFKAALITKKGNLVTLPSSLAMEEVRVKLFNFHLQGHISAAQIGRSFEKGLEITKNNLLFSGSNYELLLMDYGSWLGWEELIEVLVNGNIDDFVAYGKEVLGQSNIPFLIGIFQFKHALPF